MGLKLGVGPSGAFELPLESLLTHIVVLGATGSGKTGFLTVLAEELARAGVPSLVMDVKGDLVNLAFRDEEWIRRAEAEGLSVEHLPETVVYTPGFCNGRALKLLPPSSGDPISSSWAAEAILSLTGFSGDRGAQAFLSTLLQRRGDVMLSSLARLVLEPPSTVVAGVPLETLMPENSRRRLARELAALTVDPVIGCFSKGEKLDLDSPPKVKVVYLAHLPERLKILATSLILSEVYRWMTSKGGSSTPRLAVVFDEVRGYIPPYPRNPPSKDPLTALVRQGRGFGVSILLATQNPRDLDYKALSNVGTWAIGVLRAKQDREAVAEALADVFGLSRSDVSSRIAALKPREFLVFSTFLEEPENVKVRHTLTPLKGPLTLDLLSKIYGWQTVERERLELPQYTLVSEKHAGNYRLSLIVRGRAAYRFPGRKGKTLREFVALIDLTSYKVTLLETLPPLKPGAPYGHVPPETLTDVETLYAKSKLLLAEILTEEIWETSRGDRQKQGESLEEFKTRVTLELEERKRRVSERYRIRLSKLVAKVEKLSKRRDKMASITNIVKPLLSRGVSTASLLRAIERWKEVREKLTELDEKEKELLAEIENLRVKWYEDLRKLDELYTIRTKEVKPEIVELQLDLLWIPEHVKSFK